MALQSLALASRRAEEGRGIPVRGKRARFAAGTAGHVQWTKNPGWVPPEGLRIPLPELDRSPCYIGKALSLVHSKSTGV